MRDHTYPARLLLAIVHEHWALAEELQRERAVPADTFAAQCRECDVHPWVHQRLTEQGRTGLIGDEALSRLAELRAKVRRDNLLLLARAEQALDLLLAAGVRPVALKGLDFLHRLYPGFDVRTLDDVDLLVRREELGRCLDVLQQAGWRLPPEPRATHYVRSSHHIPLEAPGPVGVGFEIHWNLAQERRYRIDPAALFARAQPVDVAGRTLLRLDDTDVVAHLLIHHFSHYFDRRLKWVVDLQRLDGARPIDWDAVARTMRAWRATTAAAVSLVHLRKLAPQQIPRQALRLLPLAAWRRALILPLRSGHPLELCRGTRRRAVQLYLAATMIERPTELPAWLRHRATRDRLASDHPLEPDGGVRHGPMRGSNTD